MVKIVHCTRFETFGNSNAHIANFDPLCRATLINVTGIGNSTYLSNNLKCSK